MGKALMSSLILIGTVIVSLILYSVVLNRFEDTFSLVVFLGLVTFFLGLGVFVSGLLMEHSIRESLRN